MLGKRIKPAETGNTVENECRYIYTRMVLCSTIGLGKYDAVGRDNSVPIGKTLRDTFEITTGAKWESNRFMTSYIFSRTLAGLGEGFPPFY